MSLNIINPSKNKEHKSYETIERNSLRKNTGAKEV